MLKALKPERPAPYAIAAGFGESQALSPTATLRAIKSVHTLAWAFFVSCILVIPVFALRDQFGHAFVFAGIVLIEAAVLVVNRWRCPLTDVAARYTDDRRGNFDIYLPLWLASYNRVIFGWLFAGVLLLTLLLWFWR